MSPIANYTTTVEDVKEVREMASRLQQLGLPQKLVDKIRIWVKGEAKRLRDEVWMNPQIKSVPLEDKVN